MVVLPSKLLSCRISACQPSCRSSAPAVTSMLASCRLVETLPAGPLPSSLCTRTLPAATCRCKKPQQQFVVPHHFEIMVAQHQVGHQHASSQSSTSIHMQACSHISAVAAVTCSRCTVTKHESRQQQQAWPPTCTAAYPSESLWCRGDLTHRYNPSAQPAAMICAVGPQLSFSGAPPTCQGKQQHPPTSARLNFNALLHAQHFTDYSGSYPNN